MCFINFWWLLIVIRKQEKSKIKIVLPKFFTNENSNTYN